ncbi:MAG: hypothetical protein ABI589_07770 [Burkholderiales bacterium]
MDFATAFSSNWPLLAICAVALIVVFAMLKASISGVEKTLTQLRDGQDKLSNRLAELERRTEIVGKQQTDVLNRVSQAEQDLDNHKTGALDRLDALDQRLAGTDVTAETVQATPESIDRFSAAADALSQVAKELEGFDNRQSENWLRIKGDLEEQAFQLQRVQQHVDKLFSPSPAPTN